MKKKSIFLIICLALLFAENLFSQAAPEILHYNFNGTGTLIPNMASSPPVGTSNATIVGTQTLGGIGQCGSALVGDGTTSSFVNTGWATNISGSWSISFWTASITPSSTLWYIFGDVNTSGFRCFTNGVAGANNWILRCTGLTDVYINGGAVMTPQLNTIVYNATTGVTTSYLNAVFNSSVTQAPFSVSGTGPFKVGQYGTNNGLPSGGLMDEFRFYSRALTLSEIQQLSNFVPTATTITASSCGTYTSMANNTYSVSGTYTENVVTCAGSATNTLNLTINPAPTLTVSSSNSLICNGESTNLTTIGTSTSFSWSSGATTASTSVSPSTNTFYTVIGSIASCSIAKSVSISVNPTPVVNLIASTPSICLGNSLTLTASGAPSYSWSPNASTGNIVLVSPGTTTTYSVTGTNTFNCSSTKTVNVVVNSFTPGISSPTSVCLGKPVDINSTGGTGTSYTWSTGFTGFPSLLGITPTVTTTYSLTSMGANGCTGTNSTTVTVNPNPTVTAQATKSVICRNETTSISADGATTYSWNNGANTTSITVTPTVAVPYTYTVTGSNSFGCSDTKVVSLTVNACTGLNELNNNVPFVNIFPNPNNGLLNILIESVEINTSVKIFSTLGSLIKEQAIVSESTTVDIKNEAKGIYFVYILQNNEPVYYSKVLKN